MTQPQGRTALYRLYDSDGKLLYVGITSDPAARFAQHKADKHWWHLVARKEVDWFDKRANAAAAEEMAIKVKDPEYNLEHGRHRYVAKVAVTLTPAQVAGMEMLLRVANLPSPRGRKRQPESVLVALLMRELAARGLYGSERCFHNIFSWPDGVELSVIADGVCPCGGPITPDGRWPKRQIDPAA